MEMLLSKKSFKNKSSVIFLNYLKGLIYEIHSKVTKNLKNKVNQNGQTNSLLEHINK